MPRSFPSGGPGHRREDLRHRDGRELAAPGTGGRALYLGLTRITFPYAPVTIISSGLDLANPDNFRTLDWSVPPAVVVAQVKKAGDLPVLHGRVTFVLVPAAGPQQQLGQAQKDYIQAVWTALLKAAGATSVRFVYATATTAGSAAPNAPTVPVPALPDYPDPQVPAGNGKVTCTVSDGYFAFGTANLIDPAQTVTNLRPCITAPWPPTPPSRSTGTRPTRDRSTPTARRNSTTRSTTLSDQGSRPSRTCCSTTCTYPSP